MLWAPAAPRQAAVWPSPPPETRQEEAQVSSDTHVHLRITGQRLDLRGPVRERCACSPAGASASTGDPAPPPPPAACSPRGGPRVRRMTMAWTTRMCMVAVSPLLQRRKTWSCDSDCSRSRGERQRRGTGLGGAWRGAALLPSCRPLRLPCSCACAARSGRRWTAGPPAPRRTLRCRSAWRRGGT